MPNYLCGAERTNALPGHCFSLQLYPVNSCPHMFILRVFKAAWTLGKDWCMLCSAAGSQGAPQSLQQAPAALQPAAAFSQWCSRHNTMCSSVSAWANHWYHFTLGSLICFSYSCYLIQQQTLQIPGGNTDFSLCISHSVVWAAAAYTMCNKQTPLVTVGKIPPPLLGKGRE